jgi:aminoglycoside N3'-acetyltransferase
MMHLKRRNKDMKPIIDKDQLVEDLLHLGVVSGTEVLVHSSLSSIGYVTGRSSRSKGRDRIGPYLNGYKA